MEANEAEEKEPNSWEVLLRKMLPEGAPLPDEEHLDYSISFDYVGPSPFFKRPINTMIPKTKFTAFPKQLPSLTPRNSAVWRSHSSSDSTDFHDKRLSASSMAFDESDDISVVDRHEIVGDCHDRENFDHISVGDCHDREDSSRSDAGKKKVAQGVCALSVGNKGRECSRCGERRNRLIREREGCIVCEAQYCMKCVLKAMGTMPEGRKCVTCIGNPIDETKREKLGECSRALARVCGRSEIKRVMRLERNCKANQVRPEQVIVNGRQLKEEELMELLACAVPPKNLKPGRYWYDKDSGLWGKEGEKPNRIITSKLDVGGKLQTDASNGNTSVYMNGREITKVELRVLKLAKVQCPRDTHFWLYEDGSYEEEGQNNIKGCIWEKASIRFLCSLFSLPVPAESRHCTKEQPALLSDGLLSEHLEQCSVKKLLLLGLEGSGTSTIFKQVKFIYANKLTAEELLNIKLTIQSNFYRYLCILLEGREHFEEEALNKVSLGLAAERSVPGEIEHDVSRECIYSVNQKIKQFSDWLLDLMATGDIDNYFPASAREYAPIIDEIWKDSAIQETYKRREELEFLPDVAKYFLDRVIEISSNEYEPSEQDILFAEGVTPSNGLASIEFPLDHNAISKIYGGNVESQQPLSKYQLIRLSSKGLHDGHKWLEMFEGMRAVVFCVSLTDYDQLSTQSTGIQQNKMLASRDFLESIGRSSCFEGTPFLLLLNKYDLFEQKIKEVPLTVCEWFRDFIPLKANSKNLSLAHQAYYYVAVKFKELHTSVTGRKLYVWPTQALERSSVDEAIRYVREILKWEEEKDRYIHAMSVKDLISTPEMSLPLESRYF